MQCFVVHRIAAVLPLMSSFSEKRSVFYGAVFPLIIFEAVSSESSNQGTRISVVIEFLVSEVWDCAGGE